MSNEHTHGHAGSEATPETLASFWQHAAERFAAVASAVNLSNTGLNDALAGAGIPHVQVKAKDNLFTVTVDPEKVKVALPSGADRDDFTSDALAKFEAKALADARLRVWKQVKQYVGLGYVSFEQGVEILKELGYDAKNIPALTTRVSFQLLDPKAGKYSAHSFTFPTEVDHDEIEAAVAAHAGVHPSVTLVKSLFADAENIEAPAMYRDICVTHPTTWPSYKA
jgi:hypothetical protein